MKVDIGVEVKRVFDMREINAEQLADQLGMVRENVYRVFKKSTMDTELLYKLSVILEYDFFQHYTIEKLKSTQNLIDELNKYKTENNLLHSEVTHLREVNKILSGEKAD